MPQDRPACARPAPDGPGTPPYWMRGDKDAVGTAYATSSNVWYTLVQGVLSEMFYPTIDKPQLRALRYLITDGKSFLHDESDLENEVECVAPTALGIRVTSRDPEGRYTLIKEVIGDPHEDAVLIWSKIEIHEAALRDSLRLFVFAEPRLGGHGWHNHARVLKEVGQTTFCVNRGDDAWMALTASPPFVRATCGFVGVNDGRTDLRDNYQLDHSFDCALDGNIGCTGEIDLRAHQEWTLGIAFGTTFHRAVTSLFQALAPPFAEQRQTFIEQWVRASHEQADLVALTGDEGKLYRHSQSVLLTHEDKNYPGALVASLSVPWGQAKADGDGIGGYHLVWTRDMVHSVLGLLATGDKITPLRALIYLAIAQREDGGFYQNFWVDGEACWTGIQLDEVAYPILLAWRLHEHEALQQFDPYPMVRQAARYLIAVGPDTPQERWEENSGYSPSTLAVTIAALLCAAAFARERGDEASAAFIERYADFLESHIEAWTVTTEGTLHPEITRHFIRLTPTDPKAPYPNEDPNQGTLTIPNRGPEQQATFPAKAIVDAGFLHLVRFGIRPADDPLIVDSLKVVDHVLKVETPHGPAWHRYNHDGYGQRPDGGPFEGWGVGRAWPLLTGERGHYELAAGRDATPYLRALEGFAHGIGLLTEQLWDSEAIPEQGMFLGEPTGAAMPLCWAHAEYIMLLRSVADGAIFDQLPAAVTRYIEGEERPPLEVWKFNRQVRAVPAGSTLRVLGQRPFCLRWSADEWATVEETEATVTGLALSYVDLEIPPDQRAPLCFTFHWLDTDEWEGEDFRVEVSEG